MNVNMSWFYHKKGIDIKSIWEPLSKTSICENNVIQVILLKRKDLWIFSCLNFWAEALMIFIIKGFPTIVFIFIVISMFQQICSPAFFRCLSNLETNTELWTKSFIEFTGVACSDSVNYNQV